MDPFTAIEGGVRLAVRVTPRAAENKFDGVMAGADGKPALQVRLRAPPVEGAANKALAEFLSLRLGLRKADIRIRSGETGRLKLLEIMGDSADLLARLRAMIEAG